MPSPNGPLGAYCKIHSGMPDVVRRPVQSRFAGLELIPPEHAEALDLSGQPSFAGFPAAVEVVDYAAGAGFPNRPHQFAGSVAVPPTFVRSLCFSVSILLGTASVDPSLKTVSISF